MNFVVGGWMFSVNSPFPSVTKIKSIEATQRVHKKQVLTYLRLADMRLGLLINFGTVLIRDGITRLVNGLEE